MKLFKINKLRFSHVLLIPSIIVTTMLVGYGMFYAVKDSLAGEGWLNYLNLLDNDQFQTAFFYSLKIAVIATLLSLLVGFLIAKLLYSYLQFSNWKLLVWLPMLIPHFVSAYLVLLFFSQSSLLSSFFFHLGIISEMNQFPTLVFDEKGIGIIISYIWKSVPFVVLMILPAFYEIDRSFTQVVRTLGGGRWETFKMVEWPWLLPIIVETGLILFAFIIAAFEIPYLLSVTEPKMLPVLAYQWFYDGNWSGRPLALAAMVLITALIFLVAYLSFRLTKKTRYVMMRGRQG